MNSFKDFGITTELKNFVGDKIKISKILNKEIKVIDYKEGPSKFTDKGSGMRLDLQIELEGKKHVVFTGSVYLMDMIKKVPKDKFPFTTTIVEDNERLEFT